MLRKVNYRAPLPDFRHSLDRTIVSQIASGPFPHFNQHLVTIANAVVKGDLPPDKGVVEQFFCLISANMLESTNFDRNKFGETGLLRIFRTVVFNRCKVGEAYLHGFVTSNEVANKILKTDNEFVVMARCAVHLTDDHKLHLIQFIRENVQLVPAEMMGKSTSYRYTQFNRVMETKEVVAAFERGECLIEGNVF